MTGSRRTILAGLATALAMTVIVGAGRTFADGVSAEAAAETAPALKLKASVVGASAPMAPLTIELFRWSTDVERAPVLAALAAPSPAPASAAPAAPAGRAGRAGRGGRAAAPPASPLERLTTAIKAAPTVGFIWSDGPTGYSIKYAWRSASPSAPERIVLVIDRRLGANVASWPQASTTDADLTVVEMRIDAKGAGEAKSSLTSPFVIDAAANTIALDKYTEAPVLLKVTR